MSSPAVLATYDDSVALVVVDVQNDFADPAGGLYVPGGEQVLPRVNLEVERAVSAGATVVCTQDWHPPRTPHFAKDGGTWPVHCVGGTWGAELHPDLVAGGGRLLKGTGGEDGYSAFTVRDPSSGVEQPTGLTELLRAGGVRAVVVVGLATDYCVKATALDSVRLGFATTVLADAVRAVDLQPGDGRAALEAMEAAGVTIG